MTRRSRLGRPRQREARWSDTEPIRAEVFGPERFEQHAVSLADAHMVVDRFHRVVSIVERLDDNAGALLRDYQALIAALHDKRSVTPAAEWLVDNFHIVERNVRQVRLDLPPSYFKQLPKLGSGFLAGHPRIFGVMWAYVAHTDSLFDPDLLARYIRSYEARKALSDCSCWRTCAVWPTGSRWRPPTVSAPMRSPTSSSGSVTSRRDRSRNWSGSSIVR